MPIVLTTRLIEVVGFSANQLRTAQDRRLTLTSALVGKRLRDYEALLSSLSGRAQVIAGNAQARLARPWKPAR
jgi:hypothetical protein